MLNILWALLKWTSIIVVVLAIAITAFLYLSPQFGAKPTNGSLDRVNASPNQKNRLFQNIIATQVDTREPGGSMDMWQYLFPPPDKNPSHPIPSLRFDKSTLKNGDFVWLGHSTVLFRTDNLNILTDPVFNRASPIPIGGKPFEMTETPVIDDLPDIDVVIISHDHYDHLDAQAISDLATRVKLFLVPLGIQPHLERWGVGATQIIERDWYDSHTVSDTDFTLTPSRHFSGRGLTNRNTTLWGSWVMQNDSAAVFYGGDSGYFEEFKVIGDRYGPFDIAFLENGAYDKDWAQIHMMPEESVQAAIDLQARLFFPIHWGKFDLGKHQWQEPIQRAVLEANRKNMPLVAPLIGQPFTITEPPFENWWND